eukprot:scaffold220451_cov17-Tisochrysis_lutea.AAC.1
MELIFATTSNNSGTAIDKKARDPILRENGDTSSVCVTHCQRHSNSQVKKALRISLARLQPTAPRDSTY